MPQSNVTLIRPVKLLHNITRFLPLAYRRGVLEIIVTYVTMPLRKVCYCYHEAWSVVDFCVLLILFRTDIQINLIS